MSIISHQAAVTIIGNGSTGLQVAIHCLQQGLSFTLIGNGDVMGRGTAGNADTLRLIMNQPAGWVGFTELLPFGEWLKNKMYCEGMTELPDGQKFNSDIFAPRSWVYGEFLQDSFAAECKVNPNVLFNIVHDTACDVSKSVDGRFFVKTDNGSICSSSHIFLATGHIKNKLFPQSKSLKNYMSSPQSIKEFKEKFAKILQNPDAKIALVGGANSFIDALCIGQDSGYKGKFVVITPDGKGCRPVELEKPIYDADFSVSSIEPLLKSAKSYDEMMQVIGQTLEDNHNIYRTNSMITALRQWTWKVKEEALPIAITQTELERVDNRLRKMFGSLIAPHLYEYQTELGRIGKVTQLHGYVDSRHVEVLENGQMIVKNLKQPHNLKYYNLPDDLPSSIQPDLDLDQGCLVVDGLINCAPYKVDMANDCGQFDDPLLENARFAGLIEINGAGLIQSIDPHIGSAGPIKNSKFWGLPFAKADIYPYIESWENQSNNNRVIHPNPSPI